MLKPIEPGCLAVVMGHMHGPNNGKVVRVGRFLGRPVVLGLLAKSEDWWETDRELGIWETNSNTLLGHACMFRQKFLLRIDGDSFEHEEGENEEQPTREKETLTR